MSGDHGMPKAFAVGVYIAGLAVSLVVGAARPARPAPFCAPWPVVRENLVEKFGETVVSRGVVSAGVIMVVTASVDGATFTVLHIGAGGIACIISSGRGWEPGTNPVSETSL